MRGMLTAMLALMGLAIALHGDEPGERRGKLPAKEVLEVRTYPVADLVVPIGPFDAKGPDKREPNFAALERHLRDMTGAAAWNESTSIRPYAQTFSLVIRQTASIHEKIADEMSRLRRELDTQVTLELRVITGARRDIAALADAFPGELGHFETKQLLERMQSCKTLNPVTSPKITTFSRQTANVTFDGRTLSVNATISADRRSVNLKVYEGPEESKDLLADVQFVTLHSGRTAALRFEAPLSAGTIPPAADAVERLVIVTPHVIVQEAEEVQNKVVITVSPRLIIQEEEELLGIPTK